MQILTDSCFYLSYFNSSRRIIYLLSILILDFILGTIFFLHYYLYNYTLPLNYDTPKTNSADIIFVQCDNATNSSRCSNQKLFSLNAIPRSRRSRPYQLVPRPHCASTQSNEAPRSRGCWKAEKQPCKRTKLKPQQPESDLNRQRRSGLGPGVAVPRFPPTRDLSVRAVFRAVEPP